MQRTFTQIEDLVARLPITEDNYGIFEALLKLPYDIYRPVMDLLFEGRITPEDLVPAGSATPYLIASDYIGENARPVSQLDLSSQAMLNRCISLIGGTPVAATVVSVDLSSLTSDSSGRPIPAVVPIDPSLVGPDSLAIVPNPIEVLRAGGVIEAQKASQSALGAVLNPEIK